MARVRLRFTGDSMRWPSFTCSALVHTLLLLVLISGSHVSQRPHETRASIEKKYAVIWYPKPKIPDIAPNKSASDSIPRPLPRQQRTIVSTQADAQRANQLIWQPVPLKLNAEVPAPNIVQLSSPTVLPPPTPPPPPKPPAPKTYVPPAPSAAKSAPKASSTMIAAAPAPAIVEPKLVLPASNEAPQLPARNYVPPSVPVRQPTRAAAAVVAEALPALTRDAAEGPNMLVLGLNPTDQLKTPLPPGVLPAQVSAARDEIVKPAAGAAATPGVTIPNVIVREGKTETRAVAPAMPQATPAERATAAARATLSAPLYASSRVLPAVIETHFAQRTVYTCLLEGLAGVSNPTMWFAETAAPPGRSPLIRAPVLVRAGQAPRDPPPAGEQHLYLKMLIGLEGLVKSVVLLQPAGDAFGQELVKLSEKWEFVPATRNGQPVEVEAILQLTLGPAVRISGR